jgi:hypothetical protein
MVILTGPSCLHLCSPGSRIPADFTFLEPLLGPWGQCLGQVSWVGEVQGLLRRGLVHGYHIFLELTCSFKIFH